MTAPLRELRWYGELSRLLVDPVLRGQGVPRGDGRSVLLLPGFLAGDQSLMLLSVFLRRIGYRPVTAGIRLNHGCGDAFYRRMADTVLRESRHGRRRVAVVGHSRGGHFARALAARHPDRVGHVITLGTALEDPLDIEAVPLAAVRIARALLVASDPRRRDARCLTHTCTCEFARISARAVPRSVAFTSIYSRRDGVVRWRGCLPGYAACVEVPGSHVGMALNRHVYRAIADALAGTATDLPRRS